MNIVILAGGNQTRFGVSIEEQSKILYPLGGDRTVLSNIFDQLKEAGVEKVVVITGQKRTIIEYVEKRASHYPFEIILENQVKPSPVHWIPEFGAYAPVTVILGDTYFPPGELTKYIQKAKEAQDRCDGFVGVSHEHVGDARVILEGDQVKDMSHGFDHGYYTCGLFTFYDATLFQKLEPSDKYAHTWALLPKLGYRLGYHMVGKGLLDLDTPEEAQKLKESLSSQRD